MNDVSYLRKVSNELTLTETGRFSHLVFYLMFLDCFQDLKNLAEDHLQSGKLQYLIHTKVGDGPKVLTDPASSLLDLSTGFPNKTGSDA